MKQQNEALLRNIDASSGTLIYDISSQLRLMKTFVALFLMGWFRKI